MILASGTDNNQVVTEQNTHLIIGHRDRIVDNVTNQLELRVTFLLECVGNLDRLDDFSLDDSLLGNLVVGIFFFLEANQCRISNVGK